MEQPAACSISASASRKGRPSRAASRRPIEVLPAPINPTSTIRRPRRWSGGGGASRAMAVLRDMTREASTSLVRRTIPPVPTESRRVRVRLLLIVLAILLLGLIGALGYLGLNPPNPASKPVEKTLPNDKFQTR